MAKEYCCTKCNSRIKESDLRCSRCNASIGPDGSYKLREVLETDNSVNDTSLPKSITIPGFSGGVLTFNKSNIEYETRKIYYKDVTGISFHSLKTSVNFIPTSQSYHYSVFSDDGEISLSFTAPFYINNGLKKSVWTDLILLSEQTIEPIIISKIMKRIFEKNEKVEIGQISLDTNGIHRKKIFGGVETILWKDRILKPEISQGSIILYKEKDGRSKHFKSIPMMTQNAILLPTLLQECVNYLHLKKLQ